MLRAKQLKGILKWAVFQTDPRSFTATSRKGPSSAESAPLEASADWKVALKWPIRFHSGLFFLQLFTASARLAGAAYLVPLAGMLPP